LAVHYDNTWNTAISTTEHPQVLSALDVDLYTHVVDNKESDDIFRAFFFAGVAEIDAQPILRSPKRCIERLPSMESNTCSKGTHSLQKESPDWPNYFDGKYIQPIHQRFGKPSHDDLSAHDIRPFFCGVMRRPNPKNPAVLVHPYSKEDAVAISSLTMAGNITAGITWKIE